MHLRASDSTRIIMGVLFIELFPATASKEHSCRRPCSLAPTAVRCGKNEAQQPNRECFGQAGPMIGHRACEIAGQTNNSAPPIVVGYGPLTWHYSESAQQIEELNGLHLCESIQAAHDATNARRRLAWAGVRRSFPFLFFLFRTPRKIRAQFFLFHHVQIPLSSCRLLPARSCSPSCPRVWRQGRPQLCILPGWNLKGGQSLPVVSLLI